MREGHFILVFFVVILSAIALLDHRTAALETAEQQKITMTKYAEESLDEAFNTVYTGKMSELRTLADCSGYNNDPAMDTLDSEANEMAKKFFRSLASKDQRMKNCFAMFVIININKMTIYTLDPHGLVSKEYAYDDSKGQLFARACLQRIDQTLTYVLNNGTSLGQLENPVYISLDDTNNNKDLLGYHVFLVSNGPHDAAATNYSQVIYAKKTISSIHLRRVKQNKSSGLSEYHLADCNCDCTATEDTYFTDNQHAARAGYQAGKCIYTVE